jgi:AcrR family transcriptional regulator
MSQIRTATTETDGADQSLRRRSGGRSARVRAAVLDATVVELVAVGYGQLSMEAVAQRAGVHKTTLYRRWSTREALVVEALLARSERTVQVPDTGHVRSDLRAVMHAVVANLTSAEGAALARTMLSQDGQTPGIQQLARQFWKQRYALVDEVLSKGIACGELSSGLDRTLLIESLIGPLYYRFLVTMAPLDTDYADRLLDFAIPPAADHQA